MRAITNTLIISYLTVFPHVLAADTLPQRNQALIEKPLGGSILIDRVAAGQLYKEGLQRPKFTSGEIGVANDSIPKIIADHETARAQLERRRLEGMNLSNYVLPSFSTIVGAAAPVATSNPVTLAITATAVFTGELIQRQIFSNFSEEMKRKQALLLNDRLQKYSVNHSKEFEALAGMPVQEAFDVLYGRDLRENDLFKNLQDKERDQLAAGMRNDLAVTMAKKDWQLEKRQEVTAAEAAKNARDVVLIRNTFDTFVQKSQERMARLEFVQNDVVVRMNSMTTRVEKLEGSVAQNTEDINFLQEYTFGKMTPKEQLAGLKKGMFRDMPEGDKRRLQEKIELVQARQELIDGANAVVQGGQGMVQIASALGLDKGVVSVASKGLQIAGAAIQAFTALSSGNIFGAISALGSLFAPDVAEERHKEVMKYLGAIYEGQQKISDQIQALHEGQRRLMENQAKIMDALVRIAQRIDKQHEIVMGKLDAIHHDILFNRELIISLLDAPLKKCGVFVEQMSEVGGRGQPLFDFVDGEFVSYQGLFRHFTTYRDEFLECSKALPMFFHGPVTTLTNAATFHTIFYLQSYDSNVKALGISVADYIKETYDRTYGLMEALFLSLPEVFNEALSANFVPIGKYQRISEKLAARPSILKHRKLPAGFPQSAELKNLFDRPLSVAAVREVSEYLIRLHPYYELIADNYAGIYRTAEELANRPALNQRGELLLRIALSLVDTAIAQQVMLAGESALPFLSTFLRGAGAKETTLYPQLMATLKRNPVFATNVIRYMLREDFIKRKVNRLAYNIALNSENPEYLKSLTEYPFEFHFEREARDENIPREWSVVLVDKEDKFYVPLSPDVQSLFTGEIIYPSEFKLLVSVRNRLIEQGLTYRAPLPVDPKARQSFRTVYLIPPKLMDGR